MRHIEQSEDYGRKGTFPGNRRIPRTAINESQALSSLHKSGTASASDIRAR